MKLQNKRDEANIQAKVLKYQIGRSTTTIVNMLKNFLDDCEKIDEPVKAPETRARAYSQEIIAPGAGLDNDATIDNDMTAGDLLPNDLPV